jgi:hypothetical protein
VSRRLLRLEVPVFPERLVFRIHDPGAVLDGPAGPPPPISDGYEDEAKCVLYLRGRLSVDMGAGRRAVDALRLSGGVGDYGVRLYTRNRTAARESYGQLYQRFADPLSDEFQQARKQLEGMEQYLLQLWRES